MVEQIDRWVERLLPLLLAVVPIGLVEFLRRSRARREGERTARRESVSANVEETRLIHEERRADLERLREEIADVEERTSARYAKLEEAERDCQDERHRLREEISRTNARLFDLEERVRRGRPDLLEDHDVPRQAGGAA